MIIITSQIFILNIFIYIFSVKYYKNIFNPLGIFTLIWGAVPFLYDLQLSGLFNDLHPKTYISIYSCLFFFNIGCILKSKKIYKSGLNHYQQLDYNKKAFYLYFFFLLLAMLEIYIETPPLLSENPFSAYMEGAGVRFLHFAIILLPVSYSYIFIMKDVSSFLKLILFLPSFFISIIWLQRGHLIWFLLLIIYLYLRTKKLKSQLKYFIFSFLLIVFFINILGNFRSKSNFNQLEDISFSKMAKTENLPSHISWVYMYLTASIQNFDQTIRKNNIDYKYGYDFIEPFFSLFQLKSMVDTDQLVKSKRYYNIIMGFNVPSYLYRIYINFWYFGFIIIPLILGYFSQALFNFGLKSPFGTLLYASWYPYIIQSFHDFLFWNIGIILMFLLLLLLNKNFYFSNKRIF